MTIPTMWIVPENRGSQIIVNTGEMRLYYFRTPNQVYTFPIGMGVLDFKTPQGKFRVIEKKSEPRLAHPQIPAKKIWDVGYASGGGQSFRGV